MEKTVITRIKLTASEGMILTNGELYAKELFLASGVNESEYYEITEEEYKEKIKEIDTQNGAVE